MYFMEEAKFSFKRIVQYIYIEYKLLPKIFVCFGQVAVALWAIIRMAIWFWGNSGKWESLLCVYCLLYIASLTMSNYIGTSYQLKTLLFVFSFPSIKHNCHYSDLTFHIHQQRYCSLL